MPPQTDFAFRQYEDAAPAEINEIWINDIRGPEANRPFLGAQILSNRFSHTFIRYLYLIVERQHVFASKSIFAKKIQFQHFPFYEGPRAVAVLALLSPLPIWFYVPDHLSFLSVCNGQYSKHLISNI